ncbi:hypothetical protein [Denitrobaculum tricleocarpae]|uniref:Uncharacterized protein n=1 Tax=Denitrobaculum tricleocarpae TaxID=2591009 RepID=A0A545U2E6_9PROT|nr:hypothetical protein [Denitrobaculum tricleocarpae]TQV83650.1 hypothetical protein FKG95_03410 [Denitrobaculum tricleocarpae]
MVFRRGELKRFFSYLSLVVSSSLACRGIGSPGAGRLLTLFHYLDREDQPVFLSNTISALKQLRLEKRYRKKGIIKSIENCINRNSDRVFILGSGPSINDLSEGDFEHISKSDSWGFNSWFVHEFVPSVYFTQIEQDKRRGADILEIMDNIFYKVSGRYKNAKIVIKGGDLYHGRDFAHTESFRKFEKVDGAMISVLPTLLVPDGVHDDPDGLFSGLRRAGLLSHGSGVCLPVPQVRSTVGLLIALAVQMGYKEVVLCGIDGKSDEHFFDDEKYLSVFPELSAFRKYYVNETHPHNVPGKKGVSPLDYTVLMADFCKKSFGVEVTNASAHSLLAGKLPQYVFQE